MRPSRSCANASPPNAGDSTCRSTRTAAKRYGKSGSCSPRSPTARPARTVRWPGRSVAASTPPTSATTAPWPDSLVRPRPFVPSGRRLTEPGSDRTPRVGVAARRAPIGRLAFEELTHDGTDQRHRIAPPPDNGAHLSEHVRPRVVLERQRLLGADGAQPVCDKPVFVAVWVAGPASGQDVGQTPCRGRRQPDVLLPEQMRVVTGNQHGFPG